MHYTFFYIISIIVTNFSPPNKITLLLIVLFLISLSYISTTKLSYKINLISVLIHILLQYSIIVTVSYIFLPLALLY